MSKDHFYTCPVCGSEELRTIERIYGLARCVIPENETEVGIGFDGETEVLWDTSETVGITCYHCEWEYEAEDWMQKLSPPMTQSVI